MKNFSNFLSWILLSVLALITSACAPKPALIPTSSPQPSTETPTAATFSDPFAYCAAVGAVDKPDARYTGVPIPDQIVNGFKKAADLEASTEPLDLLRKSTIWRCMDNKVYACNFGANLPCDSKAKTDKTPTQAMEDFCKANPDSQAIPMSVTGHDTIYSWDCVKGSVQLLDQIGQVDASGYLAQIWYAIEPGQ